MMINPINFWLFIFVCVLFSCISFFWFQHRQRDEQHQVNFLPNYRTSLPQINKEFSRARRSNLPLSIIVIQTNDALQKKEKCDTNYNLLERLDQLEFFYCGHIISGSIREFDIAAYDGENKKYFIVLPETTKIQAIEFMNRLIKILGENIASRLNFGIVEFQKDGLIFEDLINYATEIAKGVQGYSVAIQQSVYLDN